MSFQDVEAGVFGPLQNNCYLNSSQQEKSSPSQSVAAGIFKLRTAILAFDRLVHSLGTLKDTVHLRDNLHKIRVYIGQLVKETSAKLRESSDADQDAEVRQPLKKIADAKLAKDFQSALKDFQKAQRLGAERERAYTPFVPKEVLLSREEVAMLDDEITFNEAIVEESGQGMKEFHQQISAVNEIIKDLADLVHKQGPGIDEIGSNIENSHAATIQATSHLRNATRIQRKNSSTRCLLLLIFGIILLIFIIVLAS